MVIEAGSGKDGLKTAVSELHDPSAPVPGSESEQLQLPALPLEGGTGGGQLAVRSGPGRPAGAKNKNTEDWRKFLLSQYRNPVEGMMQTYSMTLEALAKKFGKDFLQMTLAEKMELFKLQLLCMRESAPYVMQKMPQAIEAGENGLIQLVINQGGAEAQVGSQAIPQAIQILNTPPEQNQLVTDADFTDSNKPESNGNE